MSVFKISVPNAKRPLKLFVKKGNKTIYNPRVLQALNKNYKTINLPRGFAYDKKDKKLVRLYQGSSNKYSTEYKELDKKQRKQLHYSGDTLYDRATNKLVNRSIVFKKDGTFRKKYENKKVLSSGQVIAFARKPKKMYFTFLMTYWVRFRKKGKKGQVYHEKKTYTFTIEGTNQTPQSTINTKAEVKKFERIEEEDTSPYFVVEDDPNKPITLVQQSATAVSAPTPTYEYDLNEVQYLNMDGMEDQSWNTNTYRCVYDWIIHRYGDTKGCKKICNYEYLYYIFNKIDRHPKLLKEHKAEVLQFFKDNYLEDDEVLNRLEEMNDPYTERNYLVKSNKMIWGAGELFEKLPEDEEHKVVKDLVDYKKKFWGVSPKEIQRFCEYLSIPHYCLNKDKKVIHYWYPKEKNSNNLPVMIYIASDKHLFPITEEKEIRSIGQIASELTQTQKDSIKNKEVKEEKKITIQEVFNCDDKLGFMIDKMKEEQTQVINKNVSMNGEQLNSFVLKQIKYVFVDTDEQHTNNAKKYCELNDIDYNGQTLVSIGKNLLEENISIKSKCNYLVNEILLTDKVKFRQHLGFMNGYDIFNIQDEDEDNLKAFDIAKCYSKCITDPYENFISFNYNASPLEYQGGEIKLGLYYVETTDNTLFHGSNIYSTSIVKYGLLNNIITKKNILWYIPASQQYHKGSFSELFKTFKDNCKGQVKINKLLNNLTTGLLGGSKFRKTQFSCSLDLNDAFNYITEYQENNCFLRQYEGVSVYGHKVERNKEEHNIPIYIQILDDSNIRLYELMKEATNNKIENVVYRKTDCVVVKNANKNIKIAEDPMECDICNKLTCNSGYYIHKDHGGCEGPICKYCFGHTIQRNEYDDWKKAVAEAKDNNWGEYRTEDLPTKWISCDYNKRVPQIKTPNFTYKYNKYDIKDSSDYKDIHKLLKEKGGLMVNGSAGTGKSYVIKKIAESIGEDKVAKLCFTNKGAINIGGKTIHKFLGLNAEGKISYKRLSSIKKYTELIIVDEVSMVSSELWAKLHLVHRDTGVPFLLVGDWKQIPPVEDIAEYDYLNHPIVVDLSKESLIELEKVYRYDMKLKKASENVMNLNLNDFGRKLTKKNICYTNITRKWVNRHLVDILIKQNNITDTYQINKIKLVKKQDESEEDFMERKRKEPTQNIRIFKDCPIIASKTYKQGEVCVNNEEFVITEINETELTAKSNRPEGEHEITIPTQDFNKYFLVAYCITTHKSQGSTIQGKLTLWDWKRMDQRLRYTAITRATKYNDINFCDPPSTKQMLVDIL